MFSDTTIQHIAIATVAAVLLLTTAGASGRSDSEGSKRTEQFIDRYCASVDTKARRRCYDEAIALLQDDRSHDSLRLKGRALRKLREWSDDEAERADLRRRELAVYEEILRRDPKNSDAMFFLTTAQENAQDTNDLLRQLLDRDPGYHAAAWVLATNLRSSNDVDEIRESAARSRAAYQLTAQPVNLILASEAAFALARLDKQSADKFRREVQSDYGVFDALARAQAAAESKGNVSERIPAVKEPIDRYCFEPYLLFDGSTCRKGIALMMNLEESAPRDPQILRPLIAGMKSLSSTAHGALRTYYADDLRDRLERLISVAGRSTEVLFDYAAVLEGERQIEVLENIVASDPSAPAEVHIVLGRALIKAHRIESGLAAFRTAFASASGRSKEFHGAELVQALRVYGSPQDKAEADRIERALQELD